MFDWRPPGGNNAALKFQRSTMPSAVHFICADDEFIADSRARDLFEELSRDVADDMSKEVVQGSANNAAEARRICDAAVEAARTVSLFGGRKVVWLRALNFLNDSNGRSKDAQEALEGLAEFAAKLNPAEVSLIISASPVDKRKKAFKALKEVSEFEYFESSNAREACMGVLKAEAAKLGVSFAPGAADILISTVAANPRMALQELKKLAAYKNFEGEISAGDVTAMVPIFGEGDFFELTSLFYSGDAEKSLAALRRYFFTNKNASARPIITSIQRQNSILIQLRALMDDGRLPKSDRGFSKAAFEALAAQYAPMYKTSAKSAYNVFSQNGWYAGSKLAPVAARMPMKKLVEIQMDLARAFESLISSPNSDEAVMRDLFCRQAR